MSLTLSALSGRAAQARVLERSGTVLFHSSLPGEQRGSMLGYRVKVPVVRTFTVTNQRGRRGPAGEALRQIGDGQSLYGDNQGFNKKKGDARHYWKY